MMKCLTMMFAAVGAVLSSASAKIINCPTCSQDDFEDAVYHKAAAGDTIVLPAGAATWGNGSRFNKGVIYLTTPSLTVMGQGDSTVITLDDTGATYANGVISLWTNGTIENLKIVGSSAAPVTAFQIQPYGTFTNGFRLTNITYVGGKADAYFAYVGSEISSGLIDNCRITGNSPSAELIFGRGPSGAWQQNNTMGTANNIFIEDCVFNNSGYVCDANANAQFVVRFNTINGPSKVDGHGLASNSPAHSFRNMEVYGNHWTNTTPAWTAIEIRGGTSMVFNNVCDNTGGGSAAWFLFTEYGYQALWGNFGTTISSITTGPTPTVTTAWASGIGVGWPILVITPNTTPPLNIATGPTAVANSTTFTIPNAITAGGGPNQVNSLIERYLTPADYPIKDQVGVGKDPKTGGSEPAYVWNNRKNGAAWTRNFWTPAVGAINLYKIQTGNSNATFVEADVIKSNRDFFADAGFDTNAGVSVGTTAQMNALKPTVNNYGFWVTDQGNWKSGAAGTSGLLYTWSTASQTWTLKYTPFTYPHPMRAVPAPTGLHVVPN